MDSIESKASPEPPAPPDHSGGGHGSRPDRPPRLEVGDEAPPFAGPLLGGGELSLDSLKGEAFLLHFWATFCPPCIVELPLLDELEARLEEVPVRVIGLNSDTATRLAQVREILEEHEVDHRQILDPEDEITDLYRVSGFPRHILVDAEGQVLRNGRVLHDSVDEAVETITRLLEGEPGEPSPPPPSEPEHHEPEPPSYPEEVLWVDASENAWDTDSSFEGGAWKHTAPDPHTGQHRQLVKVPRGTVIAPTYHDEPHTIVVLEGLLETTDLTDGKTYRVTPGSILRIPAGHVHEERFLKTTIYAITSSGPHIAMHFTAPEDTPVLDQPEGAIEVVLDRVADEDDWNINSYRPGSTELSPAAEPPPGWIVPPEAGRQRLYGSFYLGEDVHVGVVADEFDDEVVRVYLDASPQRDFTKVPPIELGHPAGSAEWRTWIDYGGEAVEPYRLWLYSNAPRSGFTRRLAYYRKLVRVGTVEIDGVTHEIALEEDVTRGTYSIDRAQVLVRRGPDDYHRKQATLPFKLGDTAYVAREVSLAGDRLLISPARNGRLEGTITDAVVGDPIPGARVELVPGDHEATTDDQGRYVLDVPEGSYYRIEVEAPGLVPGNRRVPDVVADETARASLSLLEPQEARSGTLTLDLGDSYHFLSGQTSRRGGGDFYLAEDDGKLEFVANNQFQLGLVDLGRQKKDLSEIPIRASHFRRYGLPVREGHVYVSRAKEGEDGHHVAFRVTEADPEAKTATIDWVYR